MAPALRAWGRRWHVAEDDLAIPAAAGIAFHLVLMIIMAVGSAWLPEGCTRYMSYIGGLIGVDVLLMGSLSWVTAATLRGSILDMHLRHDLSWSVTCSGVIYTLLLGLQVYGTYIYYTEAGCGPLEAETSLSTHVLLLLAVWGHWASLAGLVACMMVGWNCYQDHTDVRSWEQRCVCLGFLFCCTDRPARKRMAAVGRAGARGAADGEDDGPPVLNSSEELSPLGTLAAVFAYFYSRMDLTVSDFASALMLVGLQQRMSRMQLHQHQVNQENLQRTSSPSPGRGDEQEGHRPGGCLVQALLPTNDAETVGNTLSAAAGMLHSPPVADEVLWDAHEYFKYALAVYGWPMYVWMTGRQASISGCCRICPGCCACCTDRRHHPTLQGLARLNVSRAMSLQAFLEVTGSDPESVLLLLCRDNHVGGLLPFQVSIDERRKEVVIAIRGSMSQHDVVTDLVCDPAALSEAWIAGDSELGARVRALQGVSSTPDEGGQTPVSDGPQFSMVHRGMLDSAEAILEFLTASRVLEAVLGGDEQALSQLSPLQQALLSRLGTGLVAGTHQQPANDHPPTSPDPRIVSRLESNNPGQFSSHNASSDNDFTTTPSETNLSQAEQRQGTNGAKKGNPIKSARSYKAKATASSAPSPLQQQEWKVVVVGHSLGAGVAALLALHLRAALPRNDVRCWSFSPPGGLMSPQLSDHMRDYCISVVIGRDMIPRLSFSCLDKLNRDMLMAAATCKVPKAWLWPRTLVGKEWTREQLFKSTSEVPQDVLSLMDMYTEGLKSSQSSGRFQAAFDFCMPGRVLYYQCMSVDGDSHKLRHFTDKKASISPWLMRPMGPARNQPKSPAGQHQHQQSRRWRQEPGQQHSQQHGPSQQQGNPSQSTVQGMGVHSTASGRNADNAMLAPQQVVIDIAVEARVSHAGVDGCITPRRHGLAPPPSLAAQGSLLHRTGSSLYRSWGPEGAAGRDKVFVPCWTTPDEISRVGLLISRRMFAMHIPDYQAAVLLECLPNTSS